jgi:hypothetical protein
MMPSSAARADSVAFASAASVVEKSLRRGPIEVARRSIAKASGTPRGAPTMRTWRRRGEEGRGER